MCFFKDSFQVELQIKIGPCFGWKIGLLILSVLNLSLGTKFCRVLFVALNWTEGCSGNQVSHQNSSYLWRYKVQSREEVFWLSALLLPFKLSCGCLHIGWHWRGLIAYFVFVQLFFIIVIFCCLIQMYHSRRVAQKNPCLKMTFFRTKENWMHWFLYIYAGFLVLWIVFCVCTAHK